MLYQLHWQFDDDRTEMKAQRNLKTFEECRAFVDETFRDHPLPEDARWLLVDEKSKYFVRMVPRPAKSICGDSANA